jgi:hypothetical protein
LSTPLPCSSRASMMISKGSKPCWIRISQLGVLKIACRFWCSAKP